MTVVMKTFGCVKKDSLLEINARVSKLTPVQLSKPSKKEYISPEALQLESPPELTLDNHRCDLSQHDQLKNKKSNKNNEECERQTNHQ